jgi:hypothetical protein
MRSVIPIFLFAFIHQKYYFRLKAGIMDAEKLNAFERWVERNTCSAGSQKIDRTETADKGVADFIGSLQAIAGNQPVVPYAKLTGANAYACLLADHKVQQARMSGNSQSVLAALKDSPGTGCAMVLTLAQQSSGYVPTDPAAAGNIGGFINYVNEILKCPVFSTLIRDHVTPNLSGNDWGSVIDSIVSYYPGLDAIQTNEIRNSLWALARAASSWPSTSQTQNLFVQNTLDTNEGLRVYIYKSFINMRTDVHQGGKNSPDTVANNASLTLWRVQLRFDENEWPHYAAAIVDKTTVSLEAWLNGNSTSQGPIPPNWNI